MTISMELTKPLYEWRVLPLKPDGSSDGSDLFLRDDVAQWLEDNGVGYQTRVAHEWRDFEWSEWGGPGVAKRIYLIFYIEIDDPNQAMLFKLSWMGGPKRSYK